ncbi:hypothetical protein Ciccas_001904 [Cichlidogyrus casuarinus]|uniref:Uncharacterized protein n=1 Tax=Cichlidogyrus casuarinus TaxID=1844966 RepID=A0ABD2QLX6_9PLAT
MSLMNALKSLDKLSCSDEEEEIGAGSEQTLDIDLSGEAIPNYLEQFEPKNIFHIKTKYEMSEMVKLLCGPILNIAFAINICLYLYGDLSVYSAAVAKSITNVACTFHKNSTNFSALAFSYAFNNPHLNNDPCWHGVSLSRMNVTFAVCMLPLFYKRASIFQAITTVTRWVAIGLMLVMAFVQIGKNRADPAAIITPTAFKPIGLLSFFGSIVK